MADNLEIRGGATEFEAAVIAVVLDQIARDEKAVELRRAEWAPSLPPWIRAVRPETVKHPLDIPGPGW